jgi:hypothetical protein
MGCCSPSQNTTTSTVKLPKWASEAGQSNYQMAQDIAARPYQAYGGDKVADLTGRQSTALSLLDNIAPSAITTGKTGFDLSRVSEYMNPFTDEVINRAASDIARGGQVAGENMDNAFHSGGAFGDMRHGVFDAENAKNTMSEIGKMSSNMRSGAFSDALRTLMAEPQYEAAQMGNAYDYARNLLGLGAVEQGQAQAETDADIGSFNEARDYDKAGLDMLIRVLSGTPMDKTSTQSVPGASPLAQGLGMATNVASMFI